VQHRRKEIPSILETFDQPQMNPNCLQRPSSTVASQALHLLNNKTVRDWAAQLARRAAETDPLNTAVQVEAIYQLTLSREPSEEEKLVALQAITNLEIAWRKELPPKTSETEIHQHALTNFSHAILNSAAFLYID